MACRARLMVMGAIIIASLRHCALIKVYEATNRRSAWKWRVLQLKILFSAKAACVGCVIRAHTT